MIYRPPLTEEEVLYLIRHFNNKKGRTAKENRLIDNISVKLTNALSSRMFD